MPNAMHWPCNTFSLNDAYAMELPDLVFALKGYVHSVGLFFFSLTRTRYTLFLSVQKEP